jgi:uncharacterized protein YsxB (DUF464 family)
MIEIKYWPEKLFLEMDGHAMAGEKGSDIVCAGASMLAAGLAKCAETCWQRGALKKEPDIYLADGHARIHAEPKRAYRMTVRTMFYAYAIGMLLLAERYPERVTIEMEGEK